jgi:hypothetical protein
LSAFVRFVFVTPNIHHLLLSEKVTCFCVGEFRVLLEVFLFDELVGEFLEPIVLMLDGL